MEYNKTGGFMSSNADPYKVDFGIFSTLDKAMACAYAKNFRCSLCACASTHRRSPSSSTLWSFGDDEH